MCMETFIIDCEDLKNTKTQIFDYEDSQVKYYFSERDYGDNVFTKSIIFDLTDKDTERCLENHLFDLLKFKDFQNELLRDIFYEEYSDIRFNIYLIFIVINKKKYNLHKQIQNDYKFAKKIFLEKQEAFDYFNKTIFYFKSHSNENELVSIRNSVLQLANKLSEFDDNIYSTILDDYISVKNISKKEIILNNRFQNNYKFKGKIKDKIDKDELCISKIREARISNFRGFKGNVTIPLGKVNLIYGDNGTGKTSLIEAIEFALTNTTRKSIFSKKSSEKGTVTLECINKKDEVREFSSGRPNNFYHKCLKAWYNVDDTNNKILNSIFCKYNYFDAKGAFRLAYDSSNEEKNNYVNLSNFIMDNNDLAIINILDVYRMWLNLFLNRKNEELISMDKLLEKRNKYATFERIKLIINIILGIIFNKDTDNYLKTTSLLIRKNQTLKEMEKYRKFKEELDSFPSTKDFTKNVIKNNVHTIKLCFKLLTFSRDYQDIEIDESDLFATCALSGDSISFEKMSTGQKVCFALSTMLTIFLKNPNAPRVIFLDEPLANLDNFHLLNLIDLLREIALKDIQVVFSTTDPMMAKMFKRKFSFLKNEFHSFKIENSDNYCITLEKYTSDNDDPIESTKIYQ